MANADTIPSFDKKLEGLAATARARTSALQAELDKNKKLRFDVLDQATPVAQMRRLYDWLAAPGTFTPEDPAADPVSLPIADWLSVYEAYSNNEKPTIHIGATYLVNRIADLAPIIEMLSEEYDASNWKSSDVDTGRTFTTTIAIGPDYNIELYLEARVSTTSDGDCFRVVESAETRLVENKRYRWICK